MVESNLAIPGSRQRPAQEALALLTAVSKEQHQTSVILLSSEHTYPYRLEEAGFNLFDLSRSILANEVPREAMITLLIQNWGMLPSFAEEFYRIYGGHIILCSRALERLVVLQQYFDPYAILDAPGLPGLIGTRSARVHLENLAQKGYSLVKDWIGDASARIIVQRNLGGIITKHTITPGLLVDMWTGTTCKYALVPSCAHIRLMIQQELLDAEAEEAAEAAARPWWQRWLRS